MTHFSDMFGQTRQFDLDERSTLHKIMKHRDHINKLK